MPIICPSDGHIIENPRGEFCQDHGAKWFVDCPACGAGWPTQVSGRFALTTLSHQARNETGSSFCARCGAPGPWLSRDQLMEWVQNMLKASSDLSGTERHELLAVLDKLKALPPNDTNTATAWKQMRDRAPKVWEMMKPLRDALIGEAVKKLLGA